MNKKQKVIFSLLKEVDEICRKHNIKYYLSPRLTWCAVQGGNFPQNPQSGAVLMRVPDMERFCQVVEEDPAEHRALESMKTHKYFPGFYLRYENTDTVCIDLDRTRDYAYPGLGINILPLRIPAASEHRENRLIKKEAEWRQIHAPGNAVRDTEFTWSKAWMKFLCAIEGRNQVAAGIYNGLCKKQQENPTEVYTLMNGRKSHSYPSAVFENTRQVVLEGESFPAPGDVETYLNISYGKGWRNMTEPRYMVPARLVVSARVSYMQFWKDSTDFEKYCRERQKNLSRLGKSKGMKAYFNQCWDYVEFCGERMNLGLSYVKRKDYIRNLYKNEDYMTLEKVFRPYYQMMQKSLEKGEICAEDIEILDIYTDVLEKTGRNVQREEIGMII